MAKDKNISNVSPDMGEGEPINLVKSAILSEKYFLKDKTIGISISESDNLSELGYSVAHLKDVIIEVSRYLLASGGRLAYGGDMRQGGFTELIFDLLAYYKANKELAPGERFFSYLAFPISTTLSAEKQAELRQHVSFKKIAPPEDLGITNTEQFIDPDTTENLYIWSRCLTKMRKEMQSICDARIFVGGKSKEFKGKCPGVLEELLIAITYDDPIYLIGAFGGVTNAAIDALKGNTPTWLTNEYYEVMPEYFELMSTYNERHPENPIDYSHYVWALQEFGLDRIAANNGLTIEENLRLTTTPHISEMVYLLMKGLSNIQA